MNKHFKLILCRRNRKVPLTVQIDRSILTNMLWMKWCWICQIYGESFSSWTLSSRCISNLIFELINLFGWVSLSVSHSGMINPYASVPRAGEWENERGKARTYPAQPIHLPMYVPHTLSRQFSSDEKWLEMTICIPKVVCLDFPARFFYHNCFLFVQKTPLPHPSQHRGSKFYCFVGHFQSFKVQLWVATDCTETMFLLHCVFLIGKLLWVFHFSSHERCSNLTEKSTFFQCRRVLYIIGCTVWLQRLAYKLYRYIDTDR